MSEDNTEHMNRRQILKRSAAASATVVGAAAATGTASAAPNVSQNDYVSVTQDWAPTWQECHCRAANLTPAETCAVARRWRGDRGRVLLGPTGDCQTYDKWHVRWDEATGDQQTYSWIEQQYLKVEQEG